MAGVRRRRGFYTIWKAGVGGGEGTRVHVRRGCEERISWKLVPGERKGRPEVNQGRERKGQSQETFRS